MKLSEILSGKPEPLRIPGARSEIRRQLEQSGRRLVVVDDDPTGTQTVHGVRVYMSWSVDTLRAALAKGESVFYVSTNSRALSAAQAKNLSFDLGRNLREACKLEGVNVILASRSDSTLRGHFPYEVSALAQGLGVELDGIVVAPAFFEAGRYTIDDIHWVDGADGAISAEETEFAKDPTFGFKHGNLREWVEEKTGGAVMAAHVLSISLDVIRRGGPEAVADVLLQAANCRPIVVNAACYEDLEVVALGLSLAEKQGKRFAYRCAACLVKARVGIEDRPLLTGKELRVGGKAGLVVVGSYVGKTSCQLEALLSGGTANGMELRVDALLDEARSEAEVRRVSNWVDGQLLRGRSAVVYTSRIRHADQASFLDNGNVIMSGLCAVVRNVTTQPQFLVAKGGITSIEIARTALHVEEAEVVGQVLPGIPAWRLGPESRWAGIPYIVFPGNVGGDSALSEVVETLQSG